MNTCQSCRRAGLATCGCPEPVEDTRLVLVSIDAGPGRKIARFVLANLVDGKYLISQATWDRLLAKINVQTGECITT